MKILPLKSFSALLFTLFFIHPQSEAALVLPDDSPSDSIGETFFSSDFPACDVLNIGFCASDFDASLDLIGGPSTAGMTFLITSSGLWLDFSFPYQEGAQVAFRGTDDSPAPLTNTDDSFRFESASGFVAGADNYTRLQVLQRESPGGPIVDVFPHWIRWDVEMDLSGLVSSASPIAVFGEEGVPLTASEAAAAMIPEPSTGLFLPLAIAGLFRRNRS